MPGTSGGASYYPQSTASDIGGYLQIETSPQSGLELNINNNGTSAADFLIASFVTDSGTPVTTFVPPGLWGWEVYASTSSPAGTTVAVTKFYERKLLGKPYCC
jgi:hypothetical protein